MKTPTLTEARRALLELEGAYSTLDYPEYKAKHAVIAAYLDAQVALNIENYIPTSKENEDACVFFGQSYDAEKMAVVTETARAELKSMIDSGNFIFMDTHRDPLKNKTFKFRDPIQPPALINVSDITGHGAEGGGDQLPGFFAGGGSLNHPATYHGGGSGNITVWDANTACPNCIGHLVKQPGCTHD